MDGTLIERVENKDWSVVDPPAPVPAGAVPSVVPLLQSDDAGVRELAVHVLGAADGPEATRALFQSLSDRGDTVRAAAMRFIEARATPADAPALIEVMNSSFDEYLRERSALLLGRFNDPAAIPALERRAVTEVDAHARAAQWLAMARLGDEEALKRYAARFDAADPKDRASALDDLAYVNNRSVARAALPLLFDKRPARNVGPSHGPYWVRVCDVAVNVLAALAQVPFPFPVQTVKHYSDDELAAAEKLLLQRL